MMIKSLKKERKRRKPSLLRTLDVLLFVIKVLCGFVMYHLLQLIATSEDVHGNSSNKQSVVVDKAHQLPEWITDYVKWHHEMRAKYPGKLLFEDPNAPKVLIRTCLGLCGGLHDRIGQLPWDLYLANQTGRVLLMNWLRPVPLENFLEPNGLDWRVPNEIEGFFPAPNAARVTRKDFGIVSSHKDLFEGYDSEKPDEKFWTQDMQAALERATNGDFSHQKILRHRLLGHIGEVYLEERLRSLGETDMIHKTLSFGKIFNLFFKPTEPIQAEIDQIYNELGISKGYYTAVHCRVRHPKAFPKGFMVKGKNQDYAADKTGLPWEGATRDFAISTATHAVRCAKSLSADSIYFLSDSNDLVTYMAHQLSDNMFRTHNASIFKENPVDAKALEAVMSTKVVARSNELPNVHIDKQKGRRPEAYYATFVDLYLAINARCIVYGVGYYAVFASKISGTRCKLVYQEETWGQYSNKTADAQVCKA